MKSHFEHDTSFTESAISLDNNKATDTRSWLHPRTWITMTYGENFCALCLQEID